jgi:hypothetical protein
MSRRKLSQQYLDKAIAWRESGCSTEWIAKQLGHVTSGALNWHFLKHSVESPHTAGGKHWGNKLVGGNSPGSVVKRGNHVVRRFTEAEDRQLLALAHEGLGHTAIGRQLVPPRKANVVASRLFTLARREARAEGQEA